MQLSVIILLFALILQLMEFSETYKYVRPYKFYTRHSWRPPRWHPLPKHNYHSKKINRPPKYNHYEHEPYYHRYAPHYEDSADTYDDDKPYVIIIQFPQKKEKKNYNSHQRQHIIDSPRDKDYIDDEEDENELKVYEFDDKGVQIKINH